MTFARLETKCRGVNHESFEPLTVTYRLTPSEVGQMLRWGRYGINFSLFAIAATLLLVLGGAAAYFWGPPSDRGLAVAFFSVAILMSLAGAWLVEYVVPNVVFRRRGDRETTCTISEDGIAVSDGGRQARIVWPSFGGYA